MTINAAVLGGNLKHAREANGFPQTHVAAFLGVDQSFISKIEGGERALQSDTLERLANLYGYKVSDFGCADGIPEQRIKAAYRANGISASDMGVIHDIRRIAMNLFFMADLSGGDSGER